MTTMSFSVNIFFHMITMTIECQCVLPMTTMTV